VDCVVDLATTAEYYAFVERLRRRGFTECTDENAPLCRLVYTGIRVDVVATADTSVGPTNRWYRDAVVKAALHRLGEAPRYEHDNGMAEQYAFSTAAQILGAYEEALGPIL
jgi:hypothetical protein